MLLIGWSVHVIEWEWLRSILKTFHFVSVLTLSLKFIDFNKCDQRPWYDDTACFIFLKSHLEESWQWISYSFIFAFIHSKICINTYYLGLWIYLREDTDKLYSLGAYISKQRVHTQNKSVRCILHNMMINTKETNKAGTGLVVNCILEKVL